MSSKKKSSLSLSQQLPLNPPEKKEIQIREKKIKEIEQLKKDIRDRADHIIHHKIPEKILSSIELYETFQKNEVGPIVEETTQQLSKKIKVEKDENNNNKEHFPINQVNTFFPHHFFKAESVVNMLNKLKSEYIELVEMMNTVKLWIQLNIPKIEDGNNFGVSIQEEAIRELQRVEEGGSLGIERTTKYFLARAKVMSKVAKYPEIDDYKRCLQELDEKEVLFAKLLALELRENYFLVHDIIIKNLEKIKAPRTQNNSENYL